MMKNEKEWWDDSPMFKTPEDALATMVAQVTPIGSRLLKIDFFIKEKKDEE